MHPAAAVVLLLLAAAAAPRPAAADYSSARARAYRLCKHACTASHGGWKPACAAYADGTSEGA